VGAALGVRFTPTLAFERDTVPDTAHRMADLLARARAADEDLARVREGAKHAGDADPYRIDGVGENGGELDDKRDAEDTGDRDRLDD
jgi:ribosome-binding factor A